MVLSPALVPGVLLQYCAQITSGISHFFVNDVCIIAVVWPRDASSAWLFRRKYLNPFQLFPIFLQFE